MKVMNRKSGFTLVEVVIASIVGSFIALVAVSALRAVTSSRTLVANNLAAADEIRYATQLIRQDLANVYRDSEGSAIKFVGTNAETDEDMKTSLTMRIVSTTNTRLSEVEGDLHDVEYFIMEEEDKSVLMRRFCPVVGTEEEDELPGGVLTAIAENIVGFEMRYFDGEEWLPEWLAEQNMFPEMVEITLMTTEEKSGRDPTPVIRNILASFPRISANLAQGTAIGGQNASGGDMESVGSDGQQGGQSQPGSRQMGRSQGTMGRSRGRSGGDRRGDGARDQGGDRGRGGDRSRGGPRGGGGDRGRGGPRGGGGDRGRGGPRGGGGDRGPGGPRGSVRSQGGGGGR